MFASTPSYNRHLYASLRSKSKSSSKSMDDEPTSPHLWIALEYVKQEETLNFYIKKVSDAPLLIPGNFRQSRARIYVVQGLHKKTWMGRPRVPTEQEMLSLSPPLFRTLSVTRCSTTLFNEFFTQRVPIDMFNKCMLRVQLCDVDKKDREVVVAECDYWIDSNPITTFREYVVPMPRATPDLGEVELALSYLPTAQRLVASMISLTNIRIHEEAEVIFFEIHLYIKGKLMEMERSEEKKADVDCEMIKKLILDVKRVDIFDAQVIFSVFERRSDGSVWKVGSAGTGAHFSDCDSIHWMAAMRNARKLAVEIHKLRPCV